MSEQSIQPVQQVKVRGQRVIFNCGTCGRKVRDYASNRRKTSSGRFYCSAACRVAGTVKQTIVKTESLCVDCGQVKPALEFYPDKKSKHNGGLQYSCKECTKARRMAYYDAHTEEVIERARAYAKAHPEVAIRHGKKQRARSTADERSARRAVNAAVARGRLVKPNRCSRCGKEAWLYGHHHNGYERKHWLDVVWVCGSCHHAEHGRGPKARGR